MSCIGFLLFVVILYLCRDTFLGYIKSLGWLYTGLFFMCIGILIFLFLTPFLILIEVFFTNPVVLGAMAIVIIVKLLVSRKL